MWRVSQRVPDNTDSPGVYATAAATEATPSSTEATNRAGEPHLPVASANPVVGGEDGEEQSLEEDFEMQNAHPGTREGHLSRLVDHLRGQVNEAIASEHVEDAAEIQVTLDAVLRSAAGDDPMLTMELA